MLTPGDVRARERRPGLHEAGLSWTSPREWAVNFGVVLQTDPPAREVIELAQLSDSLGFDYVWTFDSPVLWQEPFVIYSQILAATKSVMVGPMVTNPLSRDWAVTASLFATLNEMYGNRTVCGIGRGDSAVHGGHLHRKARGSTEHRTVQ